MHLTSLVLSFFCYWCTSCTYSFYAFPIFIWVRSWCKGWHVILWYFVRAQKIVNGSWCYKRNLWILLCALNAWLVKWSAYSLLECKVCIKFVYIVLTHSQVHHLLLSCYFSHCSMIIFLFNLHDILWHRLDELSSDCLEQKKLNDTLRIDLAKQEDQNKTFKKVIVSSPHPNEPIPIV